MKQIRLLFLVSIVLLFACSPADAKNLPPFAKTYQGENPSNVIQVRHNTSREGGDIFPAGSVYIWYAYIDPKIQSPNGWLEWDWERTGPHSVKGGARYRVINDGMAPNVIRILPFTDQRYSKMDKNNVALHLENAWPSPKWVAYVIVPANDINAKNDVNAKDDKGRTLLHHAAVEGQTNTAKTLIERGADINARDKWNNTPLHRAAWKNHTDTVKLLIEKGADIDARNNWIATPLHLAALHGNIETVRHLIKEGADINAREKDGNTPLFLAKREGHTATAELLRQHGGKE